MWNIVKISVIWSRCLPGPAVNGEKKKYIYIYQVQVAPNSNNSWNESPQMLSVHSSSQAESHEQVAQTNCSHRGFLCARQVWNLACSLRSQKMVQRSSGFWLGSQRQLQFHLCTFAKGKQKTRNMIHKMWDFWKEWNDARWPCQAVLSEFPQIGASCWIKESKYCWWKSWAGSLASCSAAVRSQYIDLDNLILQDLLKKLYPSKVYFFQWTPVCKTEAHKSKRSI